VRNYVTHTLIIKFIRFGFCSWVTLHVMWFSLFFWKREVKENMSEWDRVRSCWI
jgi:hypothetical protein